MSLLIFPFLLLDEQDNFNRQKIADNDLLGEGYDYEGIMHYGKNAFTKNGKPVLEALGDPNQKLGNDYGLSPSDIIKVNALYDCRGKLQGYLPNP